MKERKLEVMGLSESALRKTTSCNWFSYALPLHKKLSKGRNRRAFSQLCSTVDKPVQDSICSCCKPVASQTCFQITILHIT